jgi:hypothetical protein
MRIEYVRRPVRSWVSDTDTPEDRPSCTVYEPYEDPIDTGLFDANGARLYRIETRDRIGFVIR